MRTHKSKNSNQKNLRENDNISNKRAFPCTECGKLCSSRSNLAVHVRRHSGKMTNFCKICSKGYPRSTDLTIHMR